MSDIENCCICGKRVKKIYEMKYIGLLGLNHDEYIENIAICPECEFIFTQNPFTELELENRYKNLSKYEFNDSDNNFVESSDFMQRSKVQKHFLEENCEKINSIIEIGSATGYNLSLYQKEGIEVFGIEPSEKNKKIAFQKYGVNLYADTFQNYLKSNDNTKNKKYDLIFLSGVLEHIVNPMKFILELKEFSKKYIFIDVPTFDYKFSDEVFGMFCDEHVNYFSLKSIKELMEKAGYHLINGRIELYLKTYVPSGSPGLYTLWEKNEVGKEYHRNIIVNDTTKVFEQYIKDSEIKLQKIKEIIDNINDDDKLAVWGVGNHTARLLGMTNLKNKNIVKFYDSDIKKHKYRVLNKEITSFNVEDILQNKVDKVLISSYVSQNVINNVLKENVPNEKIIKLYDI